MRSKLYCLLLFLAILAVKPSQAQSPLQPAELLCEYLKSPLGIDIASPRFSWTFNSEKRNQYQSAYEIVMGDSETSISKGEGNTWATGKITSAQNTNIAYTGSKLQSFTRYYWRVRVYNQDNQLSAWSPVNWFETAMLNDADWKAQWISDGSKNAEREEDRYKSDPMPLFRKEFTANHKIASARLYITGLGYYEAYLNGKKVGDHVLDPGFTKYSKQVEYEVYDVTNQIHSGKNVAGVMLGSGWWNPLPMKFFGRWSLADYQQTGRPCFKAEIHLKFDDGSEQVTPTGEDWLTAPGPIVKNNVYLGEEYDARLEQKNWCSTGADAAAWHPAILTAGPSGMLTKQMQPAIKVTKVLKAISVNEITPGVYIVDMGQNFAGVAHIKVQGLAGTKIAMRYGETLFKDGSLNFATAVFTQIKKGGIKAGPGAPETAWQQDNYILKGKGVEEWSPRFTFHAFRYLEVTGWPGKPTVDDFTGLRMNSDLQQDGDFSCSNQLLNQMHTAAQWTFLSNVFSVESDCPGREKFGYGADMVTASDSYLYNYDMANFYTKAVTDFANDQRPQGGITEIAPFVGIADRGYGDDSGPMGWQLAFAYLQKRLYEYYGDKRIIEENYPALLRQIDFLQSKTVEGLFYWDIGDHETIDPKAEGLTASAFYFHNLSIAADLAGILSKPDDSVRLSKMANRVKTLIVNKYWVPGTGRFDNATQGAQLFALQYHFSPQDSLSFEQYLDEVKRHNGHLATGIFSTKMMFNVLREHNRNDIAYSIATQKDYPGWNFMLTNGATTLWESWDDPAISGASLNHPMFGSFEEWFYRSLLGINADGPGFSKITIKPQPAGDLTWAKGSYKSIKGNIASDWKIDSGQFTLNVTIPANTSATVFIPAKKGGEVKEDGKALTDVVYKDGYVVVKVGSGMYLFTAARN